MSHGYVDTINEALLIAQSFVQHKISKYSIVMVMAYLTLMPVQCVLQWKSATNSSIHLKDESALVREVTYITEQGVSPNNLNLVWNNKPSLRGQLRKHVIHESQTANMIWSERLWLVAGLKPTNAMPGLKLRQCFVFHRTYQRYLRPLKIILSRMLN